MKKTMNIRKMTYVALFTVVIAVCSWITIPAAVPFTLQTFAVFAACALLGGKLGLYAVCLYILLGAVGTLLGPTGGYILGFVFTALAMWGVEAKFGRKPAALVAGMAAGLILCYAFGTAWFMVVYARANGAIGLGAALSMCVIPFILPDCVKIALAMLVAARLRPHLKL